ncbi:DUF6680 family protein [Marispirochaeta aestuarii]|uniref:DUF6680 family protein n=1 Tax=Marispirochaeta aestuarii TaxID=1963862 RepID=UPI0029C832F8|nr:DUF6680 family protein [Marispirochaeta aestuarii]
MADIQLFDYLTIAAILLGPIISVQISKLIDNLKLSHERKNEIFKSLMATRGSTLAPEHVRSLNLIDIEFSKKKHKDIRDKWKEYFDHLCDSSYGEEKVEEWSRKKEDLLVDLLFTMGKKLKYSFDKVQIKRHVYSPKGYQEFEEKNELIRNLFIQVLDGKRTLNVTINNESNKST